MSRRGAERLPSARHRGLRPLANWGQPNDGLLYDDPSAATAPASPASLMLDADEALEQFDEVARDVLGTN